MGVVVVPEMYTKVMGVTFCDEGEFGDRQENVRGLDPGQELVVVCEDENPFDPNAMKLFADVGCVRPIGYVKKELARDLREQMRKGWKYRVFVVQVTGVERDEGVCGVNVKIVASKYDETDDNG